VAPSHKIEKTKTFLLAELAPNPSTKMDEPPRISKSSVKLSRLSKTIPPPTSEHIKRHIQSLFTETSPALPKLTFDILLAQALALGSIYIAFVGEERHAIIRTAQGYRVLEGSIHGTKNHYPSITDWCETIGAKYEDVLVAGKPKRD
jgi:hypothetical protein